MVDDHDFEITHVIRAEEHLSNTPRQIFIAQSLGYPLPEYAHLPFVAEPGSKNKLSKRKLDKYLKNRDFAQIYEHGQAIAAALGLTTTADTFNPVIVDFYEQVGYLPDAIINYLVLLGWSLDDKTEFFTRRADDRQLFARAGDQGAGQLRPEKAVGVRGPLHAAVAAQAESRARCSPICSGPAWWPIRRRAKIAPEADGDRRRGRRPAEGVWRHSGLCRLLLSRRGRLRREGVRQAVAQAGPRRELLDEVSRRAGRARRFFESPAAGSGAAAVSSPSRGSRTGDIIHAVRVATTGKSVGPGLYDCLAILGKPVVLARIDRALEKAAASAATGGVTGCSGTTIRERTKLPRIFSPSAWLFSG